MTFADFKTFTVLTKGIFTTILLLPLFNEELGGFKKIEIGFDFLFLYGTLKFSESIAFENEIGFDFLFLYGTLKFSESIAFENELICLVIYFLLILRMIFGILIFRKERLKQKV
jgi:hypothetical protein